MTQIPGCETPRFVRQGAVRAPMGIRQPPTPTSALRSGSLSSDSCQAGDISAVASALGQRGDIIANRQGSSSCFCCSRARSGDASRLPAFGIETFFGGAPTPSQAMLHEARPLVSVRPGSLHLGSQRGAVLGLGALPSGPGGWPLGTAGVQGLPPGTDERTGDRAGPRTPQAVSRRRAPGCEPAPKVALLWIFGTNCSFSRVRTGATTRETSAGEGHCYACRAHDQ
jgi:hypothetical protein